MNDVKAVKLSVGYGGADIVKSIDVNIPINKTTAIIGPNGCGKSTMLKAISNIIPYKGDVIIGGKNIETYSRKRLAKILAMLPQKPEATSGLTVEELVAYGRHPYVSGIGNLRKEDYDMILWALKVTGVEAFRKKKIETLSGGQKQRVWIALCLAQDTEIIFLDEPTTYLDISHQLEILEILDDLKENHGKTIVMVLHDLNQASKYADNLIALKDGQIVKEGTSQDVIQEDVLKELFNIKADIKPDKETGKPLCLSFNLI